jgi:hypothetical protein
MMDKQSWIITLERDDETGELILPLPEQLLESQEWKTGDVLEWIDNKDGSWTMKKKEELQWVLVEAISQFRQRYMVQVPVGTDQFGNNKANWALDTVTLEEAKEFSQKHLGEVITSHRVVTEKEALALCDEDNEYTQMWNDEHKIKTFFTKMDEHISDNDYAQDQG